MGLTLFRATLFWSLFWLVMGFALCGSFVSMSRVPINQGGPMLALIAWVVCILCLIALCLLVLWIWEGWLYKRIPLSSFRKSRKCLAALAAIIAIFCIGRLIFKVGSRGSLDQEFLAELMAYSVFWVLAPPIWFFIEYFAVESNCIDGLAKSAANLKTIKDYADYASKIWAGVLALLGALIALKLNK